MDLQECREACGGQGLKTDNRVGAAKTEYDVRLTFEGDNNVLMQQVSKALLGDYFSAQRKGKPLKGLGLDHINGPCPIIPSVLDRNVLRKKNFQLALFQLREQSLLELLSAKVKKLLLKGLSMTDAVIVSYQLAEHLGAKFSECTVLQSILGAEDLQTSGHLKDVLGLMRILYVLSAADQGPVFMRYGYLSTTQSQLIAKEVAALCAEVWPHALNLVHSFGIPQSLLGPIASNWIENNSWANGQQ